MIDGAPYQSRLTAEKSIYDGCLDVHNLPAIFHYWSDAFVRPKLEPFGFACPNDAFKVKLQEHCRRDSDRVHRFISIGSGNCDLEIEIASHLRQEGHSNFRIECLDVSAPMLERGRCAAEQSGVASFVIPVYGDFNQWNPGCEYDAVIANQSLHHVSNLEHLFAEIRRSLRAGGSFIISDMIGRNGHQRWPEALAIVHEFWRQLPPSYRFNHRLKRYEELYESWDCSTEGFEGIRSQDILPLLVDQFQFHAFVPFGNIIDPFVDRAFGPNFDASAEWDRHFIDEVHKRDDREIRSGRVKPTHMLAVVGNDVMDSPDYHDGLSPAYCVRSSYSPGPVLVSAPSSSAYCWNSWPHNSEQELEIACRRLAEAEIRMDERNTKQDALEREVEARTAWARGIERDLEERTAWALQLEKDLIERTSQAVLLQRTLEEHNSSVQTLTEAQSESAKMLEAHLQARTEQVSQLERELDVRTEWALRLGCEAKEWQGRVAALEKEIQGYVHNPFRFAARLAWGAKNRMAGWAAKFR